MIVLDISKYQGGDFLELSYCFKYFIGFVLNFKKNFDESLTGTPFFLI